MSDHVVCDQNDNVLYRYTVTGDRTYLQDKSGNPHGSYKSLSNGDVEYYDNKDNLVCVIPSRSFGKTEG